MMCAGPMFQLQSIQEIRCIIEDKINQKKKKERQPIKTIAMVFQLNFIVSIEMPKMFFSCFVMSTRQR